jgi:transposase InsO family protein
MLEERKRFVLESLREDKNLTFSALCENYNISTKTGYKWIDRFIKHGEDGLKDLSRMPLTSPTKISAEIKQIIIAIRHQYPKWGPKKIRVEFINEHKHLVPPSEGTIGNILQKHGLSESRVYRRHVAKTAPLSACQQPNHIWMYDFKGWFLTKDGKKCEPLTVTDGFSRYLFTCEHMERKRTNDVWQHLERLFLEYGLPDKMRSDNGPPFASLGVGRLSPLAIKLIKVGVIPEWIAPGRPEQNGRHERFHLTLKQETANPPALTLSLQKAKFEQFKNYYNNKRPHEAIGQKTPGSVYVPSNRIWNGKFKSPEYQQEYEVRKVRSSGEISWKGHDFFISESLEGEYVGIKEIDVGILGLYYGQIILGEIDLNKGFKRR